MPKRSAGLILFRRTADEVEVLLAHPGGPFWARKDAAAWSIPKGEYVVAAEDALSAALREFSEETGHPPPQGRVIPLGEAIQPSRKIVTAFAVEGDFDPVQLAGDTVEIEWPPRSGRKQRYPEIDRVAWFGLAEASRRVLPGQRPLLDRLSVELSREPGRPRAVPPGR